MYNYINEDLFRSIEEKIQDHHSGPYKEIKIDGIYWQAILNSVLLEQGYETKHDVKSHAKGADIEIKNTFGGRISCKGGSFHYDSRKRKTIKISSFRSKAHKTLKEKLSFFDEGHEDIIFSLAYTKNKNSYAWARKLGYDYLISVINPFVSFSDLEWEDNGRRWISKNGFIDSEICKSQSDQLWYWYPLDCIEKQFHIVL